MPTDAPPELDPAHGAKPAAAGPVLLAIARAAVGSALDEPLPAPEDAPWLKKRGACFVTLTQRGRLRGCMGSLDARQPLLADVKENAVAAATRDWRFAPLTPEELPLTRIEVSLLSPLEPMTFTSEADALAQLRPGVDGVVFECGRYRSTFLPQVWEQLPTPQEFMARLKYKSGLPADFWSDEVGLQRYSVQKWKEPEPDLR
jgi:AmmeMemoRadiSam system protein A